jgi:hypothetical protein
MGGLGFILVIALYIFVAYKVVAAMERRWIKKVAIIVVLLIPTADAIYGRIKLRSMCEAEAGLKIFRVAEHVEGFMDDGSHSDYWVKEHGYQFSENRLTNDKTTRYSKQNGQLIREDNVMPRSQYRVSSTFGNTKDIYLRSQFVVDTPQGEILATDTQIAFNGGWAERFLAQFSDAGGGTVAWCSNTELDSVIRHRRLVSSTLKH